MFLLFQETKIEVHLGAEFCKGLGSIVLLLPGNKACQQACIQALNLNAILGYRGGVSLCCFLAGRSVLTFQSKVLLPFLGHGPKVKPQYKPGEVF